MGLFDRKYCDVCGEKIGLLGNRKLEDGNLCKDCAKKLSPWFNERRHSTVDEIKAQLAYREENRQKVARFHVSRVIGDNWKVLFDETNRWIIVSRSSGPNENENPDVIDYSAITGCRMDIDETKTEQYRETADGKKESYNPPRYSYSYDFDLFITVNCPWFDEIRIRLNPRDVDYEPQPMASISLFGRTLTSGGPDPEECADYRKYRDMGQEICDALDCARGARQETPAQAEPAEPAAPAAPVAGDGWNCPACGANNTGRFCESCGSPRPAPQIAGCASCGWQPQAGQPLPKFCPECGSPIRR